MTNRLKPIMQSLVSPTHSSFIPCKQIIDNIVIYHEVLHSMITKNSSKGWMIIKIDLEKAHDRLSWQFIHESLEEMDFLANWTHNIMQCVETPSKSILWNGGRQLNRFNLTRGIRQGDVSPYLFVLCMEALSQII